MTAQDTIKLFSDSTKVLPLDSLAKADSLARADSLAAVDSLRRVDSLAAVAELNRGVVGTPHPSLPQTESWVFLAVLVLFFLFTLSAARSGGLLNEMIKNFFQTKERSNLFSKATLNEFWLRIFFIVFSTGVLSFVFYLNLYQPQIGFSTIHYLGFLVVTWLFFGLKSMLIDLLGFVFLDPANQKMAKKSYFDILIFLGIALFPLLLMHIYASAMYVGFIVILEFILFAGAFMLMVIKLFQIFFYKIVASFYILLYLCTLEILPLFGMYQVYKLLV